MQTAGWKCPQTPAQDVYEIRPRNDRDGFDLISDGLRRGPIWYAGPDAVRNAVSFAKYNSRSRSRSAMIRVFDEAGNVTEAHEQYLSELPLQILRFEKLVALDRL